jgi:hypothetical protein
MPFDSTPELPIEARIIDEVLNILGISGRDWLHRKWNDGRKYCMLGALEVAKRRLGIYESRDIEQLIVDAIKYFHSVPLNAKVNEIVLFNDALGRTFSEVRHVLMVARYDALMRKPIKLDPSRQVSIERSLVDALVATDIAAKPARRKRQLVEA